MSTTETGARSAFDLLSKPTLDLTDKDIEDICKDLRAKRERFLAGQKDNPPKPKAAEPPKTAEEKAALGDSILGDVGNLF
jgi:hypothetical protein